MPRLVTVAIPTLDAGPEFTQTLGAVRAQRLDRELELVVCDSGSRDGTVAIARAHEARVIEISRASFSHGRTRNLLMEQARGDHVAFLTQDATPAAQDWLAELLGGFELAENAALTFGPYRPRPDASISVARELTTWFRSFSDGAPRIDWLAPGQRDAPGHDFLGHVGFFTDANGCVARWAWEQVPFRDIAYAEDHLLAQDMLRAGFSKIYLPGAPVVHSHEYSPVGWLRRSFDEARAVREVYGWAPSGDLRSAIRNLRGSVASDWRWARSESVRDGRLPSPDEIRMLLSSATHHGARALGALLASHSDRLPGHVAAQLSLEGRR